jgi:ferritin-like metal-binding protein YciE
MPINKYSTLTDLLLLKLQALYDTEHELVKALPKMAKAAYDEELTAGFRTHLEETKEHVRRLDEAFQLLSEDPKKIKGEAIRGLVEDGEWVIKNIKSSAARDAALIGAASYVEHYEIAGYTIAREWALFLGETEIVSLLEETLAEEQHADAILSALGKTKINERVDIIKE